MLRFIVMNCGYVESATTSSIIYGSDYLRKATFSSYKAAIIGALWPPPEPQP